MELFEKFWAEKPENGRCHWLFASGIYRLNFMKCVDNNDTGSKGFIIVSTILKLYEKKMKPYSTINSM